MSVGDPDSLLPPEVPQRPKPKRLRPGRANRNEVLASIEEDRRPIAEVALQGMAAVRKRVKEENAKIAEAGGTPMPEASGLEDGRGDAAATSGR